MALYRLYQTSLGEHRQLLGCLRGAQNLAADIGESLVASYLRYVERCNLVVVNTQLEDQQGEIDVLGIRLDEPRGVFFCEVTTHILGMQYGSYDQTVKKVEEKIARARHFAAKTFPDDRPRYEIWSPVVPKGKLTSRFEQLEQAFSDDDLNVQFIINDKYAERVQRLIDHARTNPSATSDPAYRLLQILTRLRGRVNIGMPSP